jgi:transposase-like protein
MDAATTKPIRNRCTELVQLIEATACEVTIDRTNGACALTLYTRSGIHRALLPLRTFCERLRGETDANGRPFPDYAEGRRRNEEAEAAARQVARSKGQVSCPAAARAAGLTDGVAPPVMAVACAVEETSAPIAVGEQLPPADLPPAPYDREAAYELALADLTRDPRLSVTKAAAVHGVERGALSAWLRFHRREIWEKLRGERKFQRRRPAGPAMADGQSQIAEAPAWKALPVLPAYSPATVAEREAILRRAWECYIADPAVTVFQIAQQLDCVASQLKRRFDAFAAERGAPALKPNGKL